MFENKVKKFLESQSFLLVFCTLVFALSIFLRSTIDIGSDSGAYLDLGKKVADGGRYYRDFFESNFPLSFWLYAFEYKASSLFYVNSIILAEIIINLLALLSIFWSGKILQVSEISKNPAHFNLVLLSFFVGFFLRPNAIQNGEFGTKTSLLLILLYPYIAYSFERKIVLTKKDFIARGSLMGLIPCLKPHYLIFIIFAEILQFFWQKKSPKFFLQIDKLLMLFIGGIYLNLMIKFTPEFFEFIVVMWPKTYGPYDNIKVFFDNLFTHLAARILPYSFIFLVFSRLKFGRDDQVLLAFFLASALVCILESIGSIDQVAVFYAISTLCFFKIGFDLFCSKKIIFSENKFIICALLFLPPFDLDVLPVMIFGLGGFINMFWILALTYPFIFAKKLDEFERKKFFSKKRIFLFFLCYFLLAAIAVAVLKYLGGWPLIAYDLFLLFIALFFFELRIFSRVSQVFSPFFVFVIFTSVSTLLYAYVGSVVDAVTRSQTWTHPNKFSDAYIYYAKNYAPKKDDGILMVSTLIADQFPMLNYLEKTNYQKPHLTTINASAAAISQQWLFPSSDRGAFFVNDYLFEDLRLQIKNPRVKIVIFNKIKSALDTGNSCLVSHLEYYLRDRDFRDYFLQNFRFENEVKIYQERKNPVKNELFNNEKKDIFDSLPPSTKTILYDFEFYVRKEK
jgi:hypothetical protein